MFALTSISIPNRLLLPIFSLIGVPTSSKEPVKLIDLYIALGIDSNTFERIFVDSQPNSNYLALQALDFHFHNQPC